MKKPSKPTDIFSKISESTKLPVYKVKLVLKFFARHLINELASGRGFKLLSIGRFYFTSHTTRALFCAPGVQKDRNLVDKIYYPRFKFHRTLKKYLKQCIKAGLSGARPISSDQGFSEREKQLLDVVLFH